MADKFFDGGTMPPKFNQAAENESQNYREPDEPHLRHNPPELVPGGMSAPQVREVAREELDGPARDAIEQAQDRMEKGTNENGEPILTKEFNPNGWSSEKIQEVAQEERNRGLDLEPEWDEQAQREYDRWALDTLAAQHDEKWGEHEDLEQAEAFQRRMERQSEQSAEHDSLDHEH